MGQISSVRAGLALLSAVAWSFSAGIAHAATQAQIDDARTKGLGWLYVNHKGDGSWSANEALKIQSTASTLEALRNAGIKSGQTYSAAVAWLSNAEPLSTDALSRKILALNQAGLDTGTMTQSLMGRRLMSDRQVWGGYPQHDLTLPDTALGLAVIRQTSYSYTDSSTQQNHLYWSVYCDILQAQRTDGGWS